MSAMVSARCPHRSGAGSTTSQQTFRDLGMNYQPPRSDGRYRAIHHTRSARVACLSEQLRPSEDMRTVCN